MYSFGIVLFSKLGTPLPINKNNVNKNEILV